MSKNSERRRKKDKERQKRKEQLKEKNRLDTNVGPEERKLGKRNLFVLLGVTTLALVLIIYLIER